MAIDNQDEDGFFTKLLRSFGLNKSSVSLENSTAPSASSENSFNIGKLWADLNGDKEMPQWLAQANPKNLSELRGLVNNTDVVWQAAGQQGAAPEWLKTGDYAAYKDWEAKRQGANLEDPLGIHSGMDRVTNKIDAEQKLAIANMFGKPEHVETSSAQTSLPAAPGGKFRA